MKDIFGNTIQVGDTFLRIEQQMGGSRLRYYYFAGYVAGNINRVKVNEYGGKPRIINTPRCELILLRQDQIDALGYNKQMVYQDIIKALEGKE